VNPTVLQTVDTRSVRGPEFAYHLLRGALDRFQKSVPELTEQQYREAVLVAERTWAVESIALSAPEAMDAVVQDAEIDNAVTEIASRYSDHSSFLADLDNNNLNEDVLRSALTRELLFNAVMERIAAKSPTVNDLDIQIFYQLHADRFTRPETRKARHILITINDEYPENTYERVLERMQPLVDKLRRNPGRFKDFARKHSECPSALEDGKLGELTQGKLYPELDTALFAMAEGDISDIIETEMGLHILYCEKIQRSVKVPLSRARDRIRGILQQRQRKACQQAWLEKIKGKAG
jgi:peptidyl-prolyl cis-trans isomerase C